MFAFLSEDDYAPKPPVWAYKIVLQPEELEAEMLRLEEKQRQAEAMKQAEEQSQNETT